ncbi:MAG: DUF1232 domain-containing protein [Verrucomicrobiales bacterium]|nr:DUF1232 domain-containing protein [Verrucomicrobiales bacterium]
MDSPTNPSSPNPPEEKRNIVHSILVGLVGLVSALYLFNPTAGVFELIPDNFPVFGNLDETAAAAFLISALAYFGIDFGRLFGKARHFDKQPAKGRDSQRTTVDADFVDR